MGHLTLTAATVTELQAKARAACQILGIEPLPDWKAP
jgi:hypothetical protein